MTNPSSGNQPAPASTGADNSADVALTGEQPYYEQHVFICMNKREGSDRPCCADSGATIAQKHAKQRIKSLDLTGKGRIRINQAGCLDRCEEGPVLVIYPQGTWYNYFDTDDIDEIIDQHIVGGKIVERLKI